MKIKHIITIAFSIMTAACSSSTITLPGTGNKTTIISHASSSSEAIKIATFKAKRTCDLKGKSAKIIDIDTIYQGINKKQQKLVNKAKTVLPKGDARGDYIPSNYKYKGIVAFRCIS